MNITSTNFQPVTFPPIDKSRGVKTQQIEKKESSPLHLKTESSVSEKILSAEEKQFFSQLYNAESKQLSNYQKNGGKSSAAVGTIIDRKG